MLMDHLLLSCTRSERLLLTFTVCFFQHQSARIDRMNTKRRFGLTRRVVTEAMCTQLMAPFSSMELCDALRALPRDSCLGDDGLLPSFFLRHWETCGTGLRLAFQEVMETGRLSKSLSEGFIFLIPKEGEIWRRYDNGGRSRS